MEKSWRDKLKLASELQRQGWDIKKIPVEEIKIYPSIYETIDEKISEEINQRYKHMYLDILISHNRNIYKKDYKRKQKEIQDYLKDTKDCIPKEDIKKLQKNKGKLLDRDIAEIITRELKREDIEKEELDRKSTINEMDIKNGNRYLSLITTNVERDIGSKEKAIEEVHYIYKLGEFYDEWIKMMKSGKEEVFIKLYDVLWVYTAIKLKEDKETKDIYINKINLNKIDLRAFRYNYTDDKDEVESRIPDTRKKCLRILENLGVDKESIKKEGKYYIPVWSVQPLINLVDGIMPRETKYLTDRNYGDEDGIEKKLEIISKLIEGTEGIEEAVIKSTFKYESLKHLTEVWSKFLATTKKPLIDIIEGENLEGIARLDNMGPKLIDIYLYKLEKASEEYTEFLIDLSKLDINMKKLDIEKQKYVEYQNKKLLPKDKYSIILKEYIKKLDQEKHKDIIHQIKEMEDKKSK